MRIYILIIQPSLRFIQTDLSMKHTRFSINSLILCNKILYLLMQEITLFRLKIRKIVLLQKRIPVQIFFSQTTVNDILRQLIDSLKQLSLFTSSTLLGKRKRSTCTFIGKGLA